MSQRYLRFSEFDYVHTFLFQLWPNDLVNYFLHFLPDPSGPVFFCQFVGSHPEGLVSQQVHTTRLGNLILEVYFHIRIIFLSL